MYQNMFFQAVNQVGKTRKMLLSNMTIYITDEVTLWSSLIMMYINISLRNINIGILCLRKCKNIIEYNLQDT